MKPVTNYFATLTDRFGRGWNRFWFSPADPFGLCVLRLLTGLIALYYVASFSADLVRWFGAEGLLPVEVVHKLTRDPDAVGVFRFSYLNLCQGPSELWFAHGAGLFILVLFTAGLFTRVTSVLALVVVLSYIHRAPMLTGQLELVLAMMIFYLCLAPAGACLSLDAWRGNRKEDKPLAAYPGQPDQPRGSVAANLSLRLMQVHLSALYLMMGLTKLGGETWWAGDAVWWLIAQSDSRLVDFTFLRPGQDQVPLAINAWTHAIVLFELTFGILIWNRLARPLLLGIAVFMWGSLALVTGLVSFCLMMLIANLAFASPEAMRAICTGCRGRQKTADSAQQPPLA